MKLFIIVVLATSLFACKNKKLDEAFGGKPDCPCPTFNADDFKSIEAAVKVRNEIGCGTIILGSNLCLIGDATRKIHNAALDFVGIIDTTRIKIDSNTITLK